MWQIKENGCAVESQTRAEYWYWADKKYNEVYIFKNKQPIKTVASIDEAKKFIAGQVRILNAEYENNRQR